MFESGRVKVLLESRERLVIQEVRERLVAPDHADFLVFKVCREEQGKQASVEI